MPNVLLNQTIITPSTLPNGGASTDEQRNAWFQAMKETLAGDPFNLQMGTDDELRIIELNSIGESASLDSPYDAQSPFLGENVDGEKLFEKVRQGRIFVYSAGEKLPCQLQVGPNGEFAMSKPLELNAPEAPIPPQGPEPTMSRWQRFANWITRGWAYAEEKSRVERYRANLDNYERYSNMLDRIYQNWQSRTDECCEQERREVAERKRAVQEERARLENEQRERAAQEERLRQEKAAREEALRQEVRNQVQSNRLHQPEVGQAEKKATLEELQAELTARKKHIREFANRMDRTLKIVYPEDEQPELDFTRHEIAVLMLGTMMSVAREHPASGKTGEENAREVYSRNLKDVFMSKSLKADITEVWAGESALQNLMDQVSKGQMELLPPMLADMLRMNNKLILQEPGLTDQVAMIGKLSGTMLQILRKDPELMRQAKEAGLTDEELRQAKASVALAEIRENGLAAQGKLLENAMDGMVSYDPVSCVNQTAQMRLLDQKIAEHYKKCVDSGAEVSPEPFQLQVLGGAPTTEAALRELDKGFKPILEQFVAQKSDLDLVNEWVGPAPSAPKKETAAVKEQPPKAKVEKKAPSAESKTDAEIRQDMKKKLFKKFADDKKVKQQQKLP